MPETGRATYIDKWNSWWWVVRSGNKALYFGPYRTEADATKHKENVPGQSLV